MIRHGGSFSAALGRAYQVADFDNATKIEETWSDLLEHYTAFVDLEETKAQPGERLGADLSVTVVAHPRGFLIRIEHDGAAMTLDQAEALYLRELISAKLGGMPVAI